MGNSGLQPVNLFMTLFPFILSTLLVGVRIWKRVVESKFAIGMPFRKLVFVTDTVTEDALLAIAQVLLLGLTIATWICQ
jgi:hypothetical protein